MKTEIKELFAKAKGSGGDIRVKLPSERYDDKRATGLHVKTKQPVRNEFGSGDVTEPSEKSLAQFGTYVKYLASRAGAGCSLTEHEQNMLNEMIVCEPWAGEIDGDYHRSFRNADRVKAVLDDVLSGGTSLSPVIVDSDLISTPLLHSEIYPLCDHVELPRGRLVQATSIGNVAVNSGGADATQIGLFNTAALLAALPATVHTCDFACEIGRDAASDFSVVDIGRHVMSEISQAMLAWLDRVIIRGIGGVEPLGIMGSAGTTAVACAGATNINSAENLLFSIPKAQRGPVNSASTVFCTNELSYQRLRSAPVGFADARRVFGMTHEDYRILSRPWKIETGLGNTQGIFADLKKYRVWRRKGLSFEVATSGDYLLRRNLMLIVARMRVAGRVVLPSSFGVTNSLQP